MQDLKWDRQWWVPFFHYGNTCNLRVTCITHIADNEKQRDLWISGRIAQDQDIQSAKPETRIVANGCARGLAI